jgi:hypothetical protein
MRTLLEVVLPLRKYAVEDVIELVAWVQRRNHRAYWSHKKRRETEAKSNDVVGLWGKRI